jgi:hypothetical protein
MKKLLVLALVSLAAANGCSSEPPADGPDQSNDELILRKGSVDHAGIVEATTMMLAGEPLDHLLDPYNQEDPFAIGGGSYRDAFTTRLQNFDAYDGQTDWTDEQAAAWTARVSRGNYLVVDTSMPCDFANPRTYLEIERAQLTGIEHQTCGGRMPNEDALDVTMNFLARGPKASVDDDDALHDGVDAPTKWSSDTFPYLADPNGI